MSYTDKTYVAPATYSFTFEYLDAADIKVDVNNVTKTEGTTKDYTIANSVVTFNVGKEPATGDTVRIYRATDLETPKATFYPGSAIRSQDLNANNDQVLFSAQETQNESLNRFGKNTIGGDIDAGGNRITNLANAFTGQGQNLVDDEIDAYDDGDAASIGFVKHFFFDSGAETVLSNETWPTNDITIATTAAVVKKIDEDLAAALTTEVHSTDGISITDNTPNAGNITVGISQGSVDLDRIKPEDIVDTDEANDDNIIINAGTPQAPVSSGWTDDDSKVPTVGALAHCFENFVQANTPSHPIGSGKEFRKGQFHFAAENDNTLSIYNGATWVPVVAGVKEFLKQEQLIWVDSENGNDSNDGHRVVDPMKTIKAAVASANHGDIVLVQPGVYREICPIDLGSKKNVSVIGLSMRSVFVHPTPSTETAGMFKCGSGCFIANMTLSGVKASGTRTNLATGTNSSEATTQGWYFQFSDSAGPTEANGGASIDGPNEQVRITKSPYIQNVTAFADSNIYNHTLAEYTADNSLGGYFDPHKTNLDPQDRGFGGDLSSGITGGGLKVDGAVPHSDSPLRSFLTDAFTLICLDGPGVYVTNGGYAQLVSTFGHFGHYHAKADNGSMINMSNCTTDFGRFGLIADGKSTASIFTASALVAKQGSGKTVHLSAGDTGWRGQTNPAPADHMVVEYTDDNNVTTLYNIDSVEKLEPGDADHTGATSQNEYKVTFANDPGEIDVTDSFTFYLRSTITTGGHVFEFAGSGTDYRAHPDNGGIPIESNQVQSLNDGKVYISSSDHNGKFKVGDVFSVSTDSESVSVVGTSTFNGAVTTTGDVTVGGTLDATTLTVGGSAVNSSDTYFDGSGDIKDTAMPDKVSAGTSGYPTSVTVDTQGRVTAISAGTEPVTSVSAASGSAVSVTATKTPEVDIATFAGSSQKGIVVNDGTSGNDGKFLKGDGSWSDVPTFNGNTQKGIIENTDPSTNDSKFLKGDGTWADPAQAAYSFGATTNTTNTDYVDLNLTGSSSSTVTIKDGANINLTKNTDGSVTISAPNVAKASVDISSSPPTADIDHGDMWFDQDTGESYIYYDEDVAIGDGVNTDAYWIQFAPQQRGTGNGTVTSVTAGTGLSGGTFSTTGTIALANTTVNAGTYGDAGNVAKITVDAQGRITSAEDVEIIPPFTVTLDSLLSIAVPAVAQNNPGPATVTCGLGIFEEKEVRVGDLVTIANFTNGTLPVDLRALLNSTHRVTAVNPTAGNNGEFEFVVGDSTYYGSQRTVLNPNGTVTLELNKIYAPEDAIGVFPLNNIPTLTNAKLPVLDLDRIPQLTAAKLPTLTTSLIPDLSPDKIKYDVTDSNGNITPTSVWNATNNDFTTAVIPNLFPSKIPYIPNSHAAFNAKQIPDLSTAVTYYTDPNNQANTQVTVHGYLKNVVEDIDPELGGNLQVTKEVTVSGTTTYTNYEIQSKDNEDIILNPNGSGVVRFANDTGTKYVKGNYAITIKPPTPLSANYTLLLPPDDGDIDQVLKTNGSGGLSWTDQNPTYDLTGADDSGDFRIRLADSDNNNDDVKLKAGTGVSLDNTVANECTISVSAVPTGAIMYWPGSSAIPSGWKECNGEILLIADYSALNTALGANTYKWQYDANNSAYTLPGGAQTFSPTLHFQLPDLRGEFIRGLDNSRGVDTGRGLGSAQGDNVKQHKHFTGLTNNVTTYSAGTTPRSSQNTTSLGGNTNSGNYPATPGTPDETRPRNLAMKAIIKT